MTDKTAASRTPGPSLQQSIAYWQKLLLYYGATENGSGGNRQVRDARRELKQARAALKRASDTTGD